jgi:hypothetical protein
LNVAGAQFIPADATASDFVFHNKSTWSLGSTFQVAPIVVGSARIDSDPVNITRQFTIGLDWNAATPPKGFFIDGNTGEMLLKIPGQRRNLTAALVASSQGLNWKRSLPIALVSIHPYRVNNVMNTLILIHPSVTHDPLPLPPLPT